MAREIIVLEGNRAEHAVRLQLLFIYHDMPAITTKLGDAVVPTPQDSLDDATKALLEPDELTALDAGTMAAQPVSLTKPAGVGTQAELVAYLQHIRHTYWVLRDRFVRQELDKWTLRGAAFDAGTPR